MSMAKRKIEAREESSARQKNVVPAVGFKYLGPMLPSGFAGMFQVRRAGRYWGLVVECPICHEKPVRECDYGLRRWRWLSVHLAVAHKRSSSPARPVVILKQSAED
jgi:hypothetical protein